jgi:formimidoylglutamate deiminase
MTGSTNAASAFTLPGMVNLHSHAFQRGMAGLAERAGTGEDSFWTWREVMYRFLDHLTPDDVEAIATMAYVEMLEAGYTRVCEFHYLHHDIDGRPYANLAEMAERIAAAAITTGIGLTLLPVLYSHGGFGGQPSVPGQRRFLNDTDRFLMLHEASIRAVSNLPGAVVGAAPHSLRAVTLDQLRALLAAVLTGPIHIHVAEQEKEVADCLAWSGKRPVEWLLDAGMVDARWCLIHATHVTPAEVAGMAKSGAVVGLCPITEANLGDGVFPAVDYWAAGGKFGIGTDSNVLISLAEELRMLEYGQRLRDRRRNRLAAAGQSIGRTVFEASLAGGRQAGGVAAHPGDRVVLASDAVEIAGRSGDAMLDAWIFAAGRPLVREVWVDGRRVVEGGRHIARTSAEQHFVRAMAKLAAV